MDGSRWPIRWFVAMVFAATWLSVFAATSNPRFDARVALAFAAAAAMAGSAVAALAAARFRDSRDPHALFVSVAFLVLALQEIAFGIWWPLNHSLGLFFSVTTGASENVYPAGVSSGPAPTYAWQAGWIVAGVMLLLALPWWDRRGRPPVRASRVALLALGCTIGADVVLVALYRSTTSLREDLGILGWVLGVGAMGLLLVAAWREWHTRRAAGPYLTASLLLGVTLHVAVIADPTPGFPYFQWADALRPLIPAVILAGLLMEQRTEATRMRRASDRAQEVMGGRAEIASMIAHEVRGPIATMRGIAATSLVHFDRLSGQEQREFLQMIEQEAHGLMGTVDQMSLALKVDAGTLPYEVTPVDLAAVVRAGVGAAAAAEHEVTVDAQDQVTVVADAQRLQEVIRQLVENATLFSPPGSSVDVAARRDGAFAVIEVTDAGPGIPAAMREQVFAKFPGWRPAGYEDRPGTGLGLFICRGIITELGGEIRVVDPPEGGTMLRVRIPAEG